MLQILFILGTLNVPQITTPINIDGNIEEWSAAETLSLHHQWIPDDFKSPSESTKVFICRDENNIYVAFQCFTNPKNLDVRIVPRDEAESGDNVWLSLDTYLDKSTGYEFGVNASGIQIDCRILEDGRQFDVQWDGVWFSATKITEHGYDAEFKIPFKTIRFSDDLEQWGANFLRYLSATNETVSWAPLKQGEGERVSRSDTVNIIPGKKGLHLELYPVGILRYEQGIAGEPPSGYLKIDHETRIIPQLGLDAAWTFTSSTLSLTAFPDFAQIEADPYEINLSKYETYFPEGRPFFLESQDIFNTPIQLFYSRRIGKRFRDGGEIPILGGAKYTGTRGKVNFGVLSAFTDTAFGSEYPSEPRTAYSTGRVAFGVLENSDLGVLYTEARDSGGTSNAIGVNGTFRTRQMQVYSQFARAESGNAEYMNVNWGNRRFSFYGELKNYDAGFNCNRTGFDPFGKLTTYYVSGGPRVYNRAPFYSLSGTLGAGWTREEDYPEGYWLKESVSAVFTNNYGFSASLSQGKSYDMEESFDYVRGEIESWGDHRKPLDYWFRTWLNTYGFNYRRGYFGQSAGHEVSLNWRATKALNMEGGIGNTYEWNPGGELEPVSWVIRPGINYSVTNNLRVRLVTELAFDKENPDESHRFNMLVSYNFRPKSWIYLAVNENRRDSEAAGGLPFGVLEERIAVLKVRYLFFL